MLAQVLAVVQLLGLDIVLVEDAVAAAGQRSLPVQQVSVVKEGRLRLLLLL